MAIIGSFIQIERGFTGSLNTLRLKIPVQIMESETVNSSADKFLVLSDGVEIGLGWRRIIEGREEYIFVQIDDPTLSSPICGNLMHVEGREWKLVWSRRSA